MVDLDAKVRALVERGAQRQIYCPRMKTRIAMLVGIIGALALSACNQEAPLSKENTELVDAIAFLHALEDGEPINSSNEKVLRSVQGASIRYTVVRSNQHYNSSEEEHKDIAGAKYFKGEISLSVPQPCVVKLDVVHMLSRADSKETFAQRSTDQITFDLNQVVRFEVVWENVRFYHVKIIVEGNNVVCKFKECRNEYTQMFYIDTDKPPSEVNYLIERRRKAILLVKKYCPGKPF